MCPWTNLRKHTTARVVSLPLSKFLGMGGRGWNLNEMKWFVVENFWELVPRSFLAVSIQLHHPGYLLWQRVDTRHCSTHTYTQLHLLSLTQSDVSLSLISFALFLFRCFSSLKMASAQPLWCIWVDKNCMWAVLKYFALEAYDGGKGKQNVPVCGQCHGPVLMQKLLLQQIQPSVEGTDLSICVVSFKRAVTTSLFQHWLGTTWWPVVWETFS